MRKLNEFEFVLAGQRREGVDHAFNSGRVAENPFDSEYENKSWNYKLLLDLKLEPFSTRLNKMRGQTVGFPLLSLPDHLYGKSEL
jgi:hypothetical protein